MHVLPSLISNWHVFLEIWDGFRAMKLNYLSWTWVIQKIHVTKIINVFEQNHTYISTF